MSGRFFTQLCVFVCSRNFWKKNIYTLKSTYYEKSKIMTLCRLLCFFAYDVIHHIMFVALAYEVFRHTMLVAYDICRILGIFSVSLVTFVAVSYIFFSHHIDIFFSHHIDICLKAIMEIFALAIMEIFAVATVLWIRIRIGSVFRSCLDPDPIPNTDSDPHMLI